MIRRRRRRRRRRKRVSRLREEEREKAVHCNVNEMMGLGEKCYGTRVTVLMQVCV